MLLQPVQSPEKFLIDGYTPGDIEADSDAT
jgi:hypothetical protein